MSTRRALLARGRVYHLPQDAPTKRTKPGLAKPVKTSPPVKREGSK